LKGPIFINAEGKVKEGMGDILQAAVEAGEQRLDEILRPRPAGVYLAVSGPEGSKGNYRRNVQGEVKSNLHALITDGGCIYGPWLEGIGSRNDTSRFKGYSSFRKTAQWLQERIGDIAAKVNLTKRLD
jgi:hypothetical protein